MGVDQTIVELEKVADEFAMVGDARQALVNNADYFMNLYNKIKEYYKYISDNTENDPSNGDFDERWLHACDIIGDIEMKNPTLKEWIDNIW